MFGLEVGSWKLEEGSMLSFNLNSNIKLFPFS